MHRYGWWILMAGLAAGMLAGPARAQVELLDDGPSYVDFGAGVFNLGHGHGDPTSGMGRLEFRLGEKLFRFGPMAGIMANGRGGVYGYGGLYADIAIDRWILTPTAAIGGYSRGSSKDLGGGFQFRLGAELAYRFDNDIRLGVGFAHISNAGIHDENPGENELMVTLAVPIRWP